MAVDLDPAAERERGGGERGGLLSDLTSTCSLGLGVFVLVRGLR